MIYNNICIKYMLVVRIDRIDIFFYSNVKFFFLGIIIMIYESSVVLYIFIII